MSKAFLLLGSNIGNRFEFINRAIDLLNEKAGKVIICSSIFVTEPWGFKASKNFLNQVTIIETELTPHQLLYELLHIEQMLGRKRKWKQISSRTIDIDILFFDNLIIEDTDLKIPHPRLHLRLFALVPLSEIAPTFIHPLLKKDMSTLMAECEDKSMVKPYHITADL